MRGVLTVIRTASSFGNHYRWSGTLILEHFSILVLHSYKIIQDAKRRLFFIDNA